MKFLKQQKFGRSFPTEDALFRKAARIAYETGIIAPLHHITQEDVDNMVQVTSHEWIPWCGMRRIVRSAVLGEYIRGVKVKADVDFEDEKEEVYLSGCKLIKNVTRHVDVIDNRNHLHSESIPVTEREFRYGKYSEEATAWDLLSQWCNEHDLRKQEEIEKRKERMERLSQRRAARAKRRIRLQKQAVKRSRLSCALNDFNRGKKFFEMSLAAYNLKANLSTARHGD